MIVAVVLERYMDAGKKGLKMKQYAAIRGQLSVGDGFKFSSRAGCTA
jgi:hypothetical protein